MKKDNLVTFFQDQVSSHSGQSDFKNLLQIDMKASSNIFKSADLRTNHLQNKLDAGNQSSRGCHSINKAIKIYDLEKESSQSELEQ